GIRHGRHRGVRHRARQAHADDRLPHPLHPQQLLPRLTATLYGAMTMSIKYTADHEWIEVNGDVATVGITVHAQDALGDIVFVDLPEVGKSFDEKEVAGVVESVKAAADVYMPVTGEIIEVNEALRDDPALANTDPLKAGWFFKVKLAKPAELDALMDA